MKVFELAKTIGVDNKEILGVLEDAGVPARSHLSVLTKDQEAKISEKFAVNDDTKDKIAQEDTKAASTKRFRDLDMIPCRSVRGNRVVYASERTRFRYDWPEFGSTALVAYTDLLDMYARGSDYLFTPMILIEDEDLYLQWQARLAPVYELWASIDSPDSLFQKNDTAFEEMVKNAPKGLKELLGTVAARMLKHGGNITVRKLQILDEQCGTALREMYQ